MLKKWLTGRVAVAIVTAIIVALVDQGAITKAIADAVLALLRAVLAAWTVSLG